MSIQEADDVLLVADCLLGEKGSWERLIQQYDARYALSLAGESAEDVMQDVWVKALKNLRKLKDPRKLRSWLYRITYGTAIDAVRKQHRTEEELDITATVVEEKDFDRFDAASIHAGLYAISIKHREVLTLYFLEDLSITEIADILLIPPGTVKSRMYNAKKTLQMKMKELGYE